MHLSIYPPLRSATAQSAQPSLSTVGAEDPREELARVHRALQADKYAIIPAAAMARLLGEWGAADVETTRCFWSECVAQRDENGTAVYPNKTSLCSFYSAGGPRVSGPQFSIEYIDPTTVHEVSNFRVHGAWPAVADEDPTLRALRAIVFHILGGVLAGPAVASRGNRSEQLRAAPPAPPAPATATSLVAEYEAMQTAYRVVNSATADGDPGPEGVHQDSSDLTVVVLLGRDNVRGGLNRVWTLDQPCGKPSAADLARRGDRLLAEVTLTQPLDALVMLDRLVKHEATSIAPVDPTRPAVRDVLTFEVRGRRKGGHRLRPP
jgi:hypothetical protein